MCSQVTRRSNFKACAFYMWSLVISQLTLEIIQFILVFILVFFSVPLYCLFSLRNSNSHLTHSSPPEAMDLSLSFKAAQRNRSTVTHRNTAKIFPCEETEESANGFKVIMNLGKQNKQELVRYQNTLKPHSLWNNSACHYLKDSWKVRKPALSP